MIHDVTELKYGHGLCPHCTDQFDLTNSTPTIMEKNGCDALLYVFCNDCTHKFIHGSDEVRKNMENECFMNVKKRYKHLSALIWACTTQIALQINGGNLVAASENGSGLSESTYKDIVNGTLAITTLPIDLYIHLRQNLYFQCYVLAVQLKYDQLLFGQYFLN